MATINKDFKIKSGLVVEGTTGTINGQDILTKKQDDQNFIIGLIGGSATSNATANSVVLRDADASFSANVITADLVGDVTGQVSDISNHSTSNLSEGLNLYFTNQRALDATSAAYDAAGSADTAYTDAVNAAASDATNKANAAEGNAKAYADSLASNYDAAGAAANAYANATSYADGLASNYDASGSAANAYANATSYTDNAITNLNLSNTYDALGSAANAYSNAVAYTDQEIAALVDSAPDLLNTLNELASALQDNPNVIADLQDVAAGKQDTLTAGEGIYIDGNNIITSRHYGGGGLKFVFDEAAIDRSIVDGWYDASGAASTAQQNAEFNAGQYTDQEILSALNTASGYADTAYTNAVSYANGLAVNYDASGAAANAYSNAVSYTDGAINALSTSDIEEGSNLYFTDSRATDAAGNLLASASKTNISISYSPLTQQLTVEAENGVADSTTDDLDEGVNNLYFTNSRAVSAISGSDIAPQTVTIDTYRKEEATQQYVGTASTVTVHSLPAGYESAKYLVRVVGWVGGVKHSQVTEILVTTDGNNNIAITEYGTVCTDTSNLATFSAAYSGTYDLTATTAVNGCEIIAAATMLSWAD